jgi:hypothetical protein
MDEFAFAPMRLALCTGFAVSKCFIINNMAGLSAPILAERLLRRGDSCNIVSKAAI